MRTLPFETPEETPHRGVSTPVRRLGPMGMAAALALLAGCDFTTRLDIDVPEQDRKSVV